AAIQYIRRPVRAVVRAVPATDPAPHKLRHPARRDAASGHRNGVHRQMTTPWRPLAMLGIASLLMNMTSGTAYAGYGVLMRYLTEEFEVSRSTVSLGASIIALTSALAAPLSGRLIDRWSLRKTAMLGCVIGMIGMSLAASASHFIVFLIGFSVLGG